MYTDVNALRKVLGISNQQSYDGVHVYSENAFKDVEKLKSYLKSDYAVAGWWNKIKTSFLLLSLKKSAFYCFDAYYLGGKLKYSEFFTDDSNESSHRNRTFTCFRC